MEYVYEQVRHNYEDFSSGRVLLNAGGTTAFPVRLASELYLRAKSYLPPERGEQPITVYDPCCGGAYLLTTLGLLHGQGIGRLVGSDIDGKAVELAKRNLAMANPEGIAERLAQLTALYAAFGKTSHKEAIESAERLQERIARRNARIETVCFQADATGDRADYWNAGGQAADIVMTDVPYGNVVTWSSADADPLDSLLNQLVGVVRAGSVVVVVADKKQAIAHPAYKRLEKLKIGKRQAAILAPL